MMESPYSFKERILVFGSFNTSKTTGWLDIAKWAARNGSESRFFILDSDYSVKRMLVSYPKVNVEIVTPDNGWTDYMRFQQMVLSEAGPNDWVVIDFITAAWQAVRDYFVEQVFHQDIADYFLQARKDLAGGSKSLGALEGWVDYAVINPLYFKWVNKLIFQERFHVYATAQSEGLSSDRKPTEDANVRALLLPFGVKPRGQKDLPYQFHTILLSGHDVSTNKYMLNTVKDRERPVLRGHPVTSFAVDYLQGIAGWEIT